MTGKFGVDGDFMTRMVMCARTPFFLTTIKESTANEDAEAVEAEAVVERIERIQRMTADFSCINGMRRSCSGSSGSIAS